MPSSSSQLFVFVVVVAVAAVLVVVGLRAFRRPQRLSNSGKGVSRRKRWGVIVKHRRAEWSLACGFCAAGRQHLLFEPVYFPEVFALQKPKSLEFTSVVVSALVPLY